ncbi:LysR family transcriptional regulator, partial [Pelomonas sp. KK5]|uniref:LysR family transcriptional regulator n=1 Tax=Pelomonas sp. KK5 TaxID=1855730 RepID=UPI00097BBB81
MRELLPHLPIVVTVARLSSFAAAASQLGMSASAVSHAVKTVENRLGQPLFARTTRSVSLTEAGRELLPRLQAALDEMGAALESLSAQRGEVGGLLRINAPRIAQSLALTPILAALAGRHPKLSVEVHADDAFVDIVAGGFDAGIRLGDAVQQDMVSVRLTPPLQVVLVATPAYLKARGMPKMLADLAGHNCIGYRLRGSGSLFDWELADAAGQRIAVRTTGTAVITDATYARELALSG